MKVVCSTAFRERTDHVLVDGSDLSDGVKCYVQAYPEEESRGCAYRDYLLAFGSVVEPNVGLSANARYRVAIYLTKNEVAHLAKAAFSGLPFDEVVRLLSNPDSAPEVSSPEPPVDLPKLYRHASSGERKSDEQRH